MAPSQKQNMSIKKTKKLYIEHLPWFVYVKWLFSSQLYINSTGLTQNLQISFPMLTPLANNENNQQPPPHICFGHVQN